MKENKISGHRWHLGWDSQLTLWSLVPGLFYPFSIAACHGLVEYRVCSSQPDPQSFLKSGISDFRPSEAKAGIKFQSLTLWSFQSTDHCTWLWLLHLFLLLHAGLHTTKCQHALSPQLELPLQRDLCLSASFPMGSFWLCMTISFYLSIQGDSKIQSGTNDF